MHLLQMNEVSGDEQQRLCPPSNDLTLQDTAGIDRQLEEEPSNPLSARERAFAVWKEKEEFLRNAFLFLQDDIYPATDKVGRALNKFRENFRKRCAPFRILRQGDYDLLVRIDPGNPANPSQRVVWGEERFKVIQALHKGEGHYGGAEKTRLKMADRYWFPQLIESVREFIETCDVCQKERVGAAPRDDREIFPTPPTAPWFRTTLICVVPLKNRGLSSSDTSPWQWTRLLSLWKYAR
jgi:hypothetical protein